MALIFGALRAPSGVALIFGALRAPSGVALIFGALRAPIGMAPIFRRASRASAVARILAPLDLLFRSSVLLF